MTVYISEDDSRSLFDSDTTVDGAMTDPKGDRSLRSPSIWQ